MPHVSNTIASDKPSPADDLAWGAKAIGEEIGQPEHRTFYMLERGYLPAQKVGGLWVASRRKLRAACAGEDPVAAA
jgi:hypothetical protein